MTDSDASNSSDQPQRPRRNRPSRPNQGATPPPSTPLPTPQPMPFASSMPDDDLVMVPPPAPEDFLRKNVARPTRRKSSTKSESTRRTLVPLLLTHGLFLPILGLLWFTTADDSPFRRLGITAPICLFSAGAILLGTGIVNVLHLKNMHAKTRGL